VIMEYVFLRYLIHPQRPKVEIWISIPVSQKLHDWGNDSIHDTRSLAVKVAIHFTTVMIFINKLATELKQSRYKCEAYFAVVQGVRVRVW